MRRSSSRRTRFQAAAEISERDRDRGGGKNSEVNRSKRNDVNLLGSKQDSRRDAIVEDSGRIGKGDPTPQRDPVLLRKDSLYWGGD